MNSTPVQKLYEQFPYPRIPLLARVKRADTHLATYQASMSAAFGSTEFAVERPRILVVGAGTFEPYIVARANPQAEVVAVDFSAAALRRLRWRLRLHGLSKRVQTLELDLMGLGPAHGEFHQIFATGVLHHLSNPSLGLKVLTGRLAPFGVLRAMLYSAFSRGGIYRLRALRQALRLENAVDLRRAVAALPADHPLRAEWALYQDTRTEGGIQDGFFVSEDHPFDAWACAAWLEAQGLVACKFLHTGAAERVEERYRSLSSWDLIGTRDRLRDFESNYSFLAVRRAELDMAKEQAPPSFVIGNEVLRKHCPRTIYSRLLGRRIPVNRSFRKVLLEGAREDEAVSLLGNRALEEYERALLLVRSRRSAR